MIVWNGISSDDLGIYVEKVPTQTHPARKLKVVSIPGRNGDLVIQQNAWENYEQQYEIFAGETDGSAQPTFFEIADWLYAPTGYARLDDSFDSDYFRLARFDGPFDVDFTLMRVGRTTITFNCQPQRYLMSGFTTETFLSSGTITNPTLYASKPLLRVYGAGSATINGITLTIASHGYPYVDIDCEAMSCFYSAQSLNQYVSFDGYEYPVLDPGENTITLTSVSKIDVTPRWWTI